MKICSLIFSIVISFSFCEDYIKYLPVDVDKETKLKINKGTYYFSLNVSHFKLNERIDVKLSCQHLFYFSEIQLFWSKDNYKNVINRGEKETFTSSDDTKTEIMGKRTYSKSFFVDKKKNEYNSLLVIFDSKFNEAHFKIQFSKYKSTLKIIIITVIVIGVFFLIGSFCIKKFRTNEQTMSYQYNNMQNQNW